MVEKTEKSDFSAVKIAKNPGKIPPKQPKTPAK
jgi:hypothetical protein